MQLLPIMSKPKVREVTTLPVWMSCFLTYLAIGTSDPITQERLAYAVLIIREAMRHGGQGWLEYDRLFRQQAALNPTLPWNVIHPGLQALTILEQWPVNSGMFCTFCPGSDHATAQCALAQLQQLLVRANQSPLVAPTCPGGKICNSWNNGACTYPGTCSYCYMCLKCFRSSHQAKDCQAVARPRSSTSSGPSVARAGTTSSFFVFFSITILHKQGNHNSNNANTK